MKKLMISTLVAFTVSGAAFAANTDTTTVPVTGTVLQALALTTDTDILMPDVVASTSAAAGVTLNCDSSGGATVVYAGNGGNPFANGVTGATAVSGSSSNTSVNNVESTGTCGVVSVTGQPNFYYDLTTAVTTATNSGVTLQGITCTTAKTDSSSSGQLTEAGTDTMYCGAQVTLATDGSVGNGYTLAGTVTVTYD